MKLMKNQIRSYQKKAIMLALIALIGLVIMWVFIWTSSWRNTTVAKENIYYCATSNPQQTLDLYRPRGHNNENLPVLVYIHGGGWRGGHKRNGIINSYGPLFLKHDMAIASVNYRLNSPHPYPDQNDDIACALTYLTKNANTLHIDPSQMVFFGESAGGQLAAFAALNVPYKGFGYNPPAGVIDLYGVSDFSTILGGPRPDYNARRYLGRGYSQVAREASPINYVTTHSPPFLLIHGKADKVVPITQSRLLYDKLIKAGAKAIYAPLPHGPHGFIGPELAPDEYKTVLDSINRFLDTVIAE
jgi:acetyl esterase/lipase